MCGERVMRLLSFGHATCMFLLLINEARLARQCWTSFQINCKKAPLEGCVGFAPLPPPAVADAPAGFTTPPLFLKNPPQGGLMERAGPLRGDR